MIVDTKELEKYLFDRYKYYVKEMLSKKRDKREWILVFEFERILREFFNYGFSYDKSHYFAIKNEKVIHEYDI